MLEIDTSVFFVVFNADACVFGGSVFRNSLLELLLLLIDLIFLSS